MKRIVATAMIIVATASLAVSQTVCEIEAKFTDYSLETDTLIVENNSLTSIDVSTLSKLTDLRCSENELTELDVSSNPGLYMLDCYSNNLGELD